ncbi:Protein of unknown function [Collimonas sp. OK242]|jgi:hypothetical protein|uniref:DUF2863 family protein n=1 Tax=Collimonas sp. OK242 TaxID=1798195 RepID=UPI00089D57DE|nr:DUF2863 family protein [Collimonas sp. OK242]SDY67819.1 Protein of unknown function [Collimonas sp. OK242]
MRRPSKKPSRKFSADSHRLAELAQALIQASSRLEERAWEREIEALLGRHFKAHHQEPIDGALEQLFPTQPDAYDALMDVVEACSESSTIEYQGKQYDCLLVGIPLLAWTRFSIGSGPIPADVVMTLNAHLHAHILAPEVLTAIVPTLYAIDQLPRTHCETFTLLQQLSHAALNAAPVRSPANPPETAPFLADTRYLLAALVVPSGMPLFHWQMTRGQTGHIAADKENALEQWRVQVTPNLTRLLPGCGIQVLLPEAYFAACREADLQIRPASLRAASYYLTHTLDIASKDLHASIGRFSEQPESGRVDEYRIGFSLGQTNEVIYGVVWPLYGQEEATEEIITRASDSDEAAAEPETPLEQILSLLRECGIDDIQRHAEMYAMEFCDDCGTPLYPDREGDLVHPEMPDDTPSGSAHFH